MGKSIQLTSHQQEAFDAILKFLEDPEQAFFILKGYAGTGKTTLLQHVAQYFRDTHCTFTMLAPTMQKDPFLNSLRAKERLILHHDWWIL